MSKIKSATPVKGFNIKTKNGIYFGGHTLFPPLEQNLLLDIQSNPHRWEIEYEGEQKKVTSAPVLNTPSTPSAFAPKKRGRKPSKK